jgi:hypothetical protein
MDGKLFSRSHVRVRVNDFDLFTFDVNHLGLLRLMQPR